MVRLLGERVLDTDAADGAIGGSKKTEVQQCAGPPHLGNFRRGPSALYQMGQMIAKVYGGICCIWYTAQDFARNVPPMV